MLDRGRKSVLVYMRPRQYRSWKHLRWFLIGLKNLGLCRQRTSLHAARRCRKVSEECTMYIRLRRYQSCKALPATTLARYLLSRSDNKDVWKVTRELGDVGKLESFLSSPLWCVQLQLEYFQCVELVINAKERRKFIIIPRGFLSKLNRSINIRVELIDRLKKKLLEEYFCDGDSKVCEINMIYIGPSMWRMLLAKFLANVLLVLTI